jgi:hypothetical protein
MFDVTVVDRKATSSEVLEHAVALRNLADDLNLGDLRLRGDGTVIVHSDEAGYRAVIRLSSSASALVGTYVHVITDDVPAAAGAQPL